MKLNKQLIERLANGEIAVDNSNSNLELLRAVLKEAFLRDNSIPQGKSTYYQKHSKDYWVALEFTILPTILLSDFLEEEFVLPEKWFIKITDENKEVLNEWKRNTKFKHAITEKESFVVENGDMYVTNYWSNNRAEITFEQFKKYVLKQETMEKEIIGYKLIKEYPNFKSLGYFEKYTTGKLSQYPEYWQPVYKEEFKVGDWVTCKEGFLESDSEYAKKENKAGLGYKSNKTFQIDKIYPSSNSGNVVFPKGYGKGVYLFALRKATQEEIEKASEQTVSMNGKFNLTIKGKKVFHQNEDITSFVESVGEDWEHKIKNFSYNNYAFNVKDVILSKTGCQSQETYLSNWLKVYDLIK